VLTNLEGTPQQESTVTMDFFGILSDKSPEERKEVVLDIYKLIFRFSIQKLIKYLDDFRILQLLVQYMKTTQMERAHTRLVLQKN
jgi:hypothetical protein